MWELHAGAGTKNYLIMALLPGTNVDVQGSFSWIGKPMVCLIECHLHVPTLNVRSKPFYYLAPQYPVLKYSMYQAHADQ